mmetsp:Transcript_9633/g.23718  ORF Transcript_9633/g.23718 Transcript_9633/m.23718 type:complete len:89 (+) Transcript_9633:261-527(+)
MSPAFFYYVLIINVLTYAFFGLDKCYSKLGCCRISELTLILLSAIGGAPGGLLAMKTFRHKTIKRAFQLKMFISAFVCFLWMYILVLR